MEALAAARPRGRRFANVLERPSVLASVLISPAVIFILALVLPELPLRGSATPAGRRSAAQAAPISRWASASQAATE